MIAIMKIAGINVVNIVVVIAIVQVFVDIVHSNSIHLNIIANTMLTVCAMLIVIWYSVDA